MAQGEVMQKFESIVINQTVRDEDFQKIMTISAEEIDDYSSVKVKIVEDKNILYKKMASSISCLINKNNKAGKKTKIILPVGPVNQYPILADIINEKKIDLKNLWIFLWMNILIGREGFYQSLTQ